MTKLEKVGDTYKDFFVTKVLPLHEIQIVLYELTHQKSGAVVLHLACKDKENSFCIGVPTYPSSSNGVPHILEHIVLCGSKKYPIKDPFFAMTRRSVNTFMNAMTGADFTIYPASSQVEKDFYHLMDVYLDAVFFPELKKMSFLQEGHRLEFEKGEDPSSPLMYKGVVFNEMKGSMGSPDSRLWHHLFENLLPDLPYANNSGGDPSEIPSLSYQELLEFHKTFYHPSHCLFYFYGDLPLKNHLDFLEEKLLKNVEKSAYLSPIPLQERFSSPVFCKKPYPVSEEEKKGAHYMAAYAFLTCPITEQKELLALSLLDSILMEHDASLLQKELIKADLAGHIDSCLDNEMSEVPWVLVAKGIKKEEDVEKLREVIVTTLENIAKNPIDQELIDAAMHQMELERFEISGGGFPYGLMLFLRCGLLKLQGCEPENALKIHTLFEELKEDLKDPGYLGSLIEKHFLKNSHFVQLTLEGDEKLSSKEEKKEKELLQDLQKNLTKEQTQKILEQTKELKAYQEKQESQDIECLPLIHLKDLPSKAKDFSLIQKGPIYTHECFTSHLTYVDAVFDLPTLTASELKYLPVYSFLCCNVGLGKKSYDKVLEEQNLYTGGIYAYLSTNPSAKDASYVPTLTLRGSCLDRNVDKLFSLLKETLTSAMFSEEKRMKELLLQEKTHLENNLQRSAMRYAGSLAGSCFSKPAFLQDLWSGHGYFQTIQSIFSRPDSFEEMLTCIKSLSKKIVEQGRLQLVIGSEEKTFSKLEKENFYGLKDLARSQEETPLQEKQPKSLPFRKAYLISSPVAFTSSCLPPSVHYNHEHAPSLCAVAELLQNLILHPMIREKGGAYGGGASFNPNLGTFSFYGYRDPNLSKTLEAFQVSVEEISKGTFSDQDLLEAKLGILQNLDAPLLPKKRAQAAFFWKKTHKDFSLRDAFRKKIFHLTRKDILHAVQKHIEPVLDQANTVTFTSKEFVERENSHLQKNRFSIESFLEKETV